MKVKLVAGLKYLKDFLIEDKIGLFLYRSKTNIRNYRGQILA